MEREGSPPECTTGSTVYNSIYKIYLNVLNKYQQYHKILSYIQASNKYIHSYLILICYERNLMMTYLITNDDLLITYDWMVLIYSKFI